MPMRILIKTVEDNFHFPGFYFEKVLKKFVWPSIIIVDHVNAYKQ